MKIRPVVAGLFHGDGLTNGQTFGQAVMMTLTVTFRSFAKAHNKNINAPGKQDIEFFNFTSGGTQNTH